MIKDMNQIPMGKRRMAAPPMPAPRAPATSLRRRRIMIMIADMDHIPMGKRSMATPPMPAAPRAPATSLRCRSTPAPLPAPPASLSCPPLTPVPSSPAQYRCRPAQYRCNRSAYFVPPAPPPFPPRPATLRPARVLFFTRPPPPRPAGPPLPGVRAHAVDWQVNFDPAGAMMLDTTSLDALEWPVESVWVRCIAIVHAHTATSEI